MMPKTRTLCFSVVFMLLSAAATISIGYTNFVQIELKEDNKEIKLDIEDIEDKQAINNEKIENVQISNARIESKLDLLLQKEGFFDEKLKSPTEYTQINEG